MANIKSQIKRIGQDERKHIINKANKNKVKTYKRKLMSAIDNYSGGTLDDLNQDLQRYISVVDRVAAKGILHKNTAARKKSRIMNLYNATINKDKE